LAREKKPKDATLQGGAPEGRTSLAESGRTAAADAPVTRAGFVGLLGPPNAGKSSLLNAFLGERLAIVTAKPQTTRSRILGILPRSGAQLLFLDTPGRHKTPKKLNDQLNAVVDDVTRDCDVALLLVDRVTGWNDVHDDLVAALRAAERPTLLVGTKSDLPRAKQSPWPPPEAPEDWPRFAISAQQGEGLEALLDAVAAMLPESPALYDEDQLTDRPVRWLCAELIREALFQLLDKELPYSMAVEVLRFDESNPRLVKIGANLLVERDSQKRIVVGRGGAMIKKIGIRARGSIESWLGHQVHLELFVKVDPAWAKNSQRIEELGYY
jgi:GTP-binding protein Era